MQRIPATMLPLSRDATPALPNRAFKIAFIISLLSGRALQWAEALWNADSPQVNSLESFVEHFREVFSLSTTKVSIHEYTLHFRALAASSGWNDSALLSVFRRGLKATVRRHMSIYDDTVGLESFLLKASRISQHLIAATQSPQFLLPSPQDRPNLLPNLWSQITITSPLRKYLAALPRASASIVGLTDTFSTPVPSVLHAQR